MWASPPETSSGSASQPSDGASVGDETESSYSTSGPGAGGATRSAPGQPSGLSPGFAVVVPGPVAAATVPNAPSTARREI